MNQFHGYGFPWDPAVFPAFEQIIHITGEIRHHLKPKNKEKQPKGLVTES